jgi:F0F1-type ATP synthase assembly protein I
MKPDDSRNFARMVSRYTSLAMILPVSTVVGYVLGYLLDKWLGTKWLFLVGLLFGIAAGFVQLIREIQKDTRDGDD